MILIEKRQTLGWKFETLRQLLLLKALKALHAK